MGLEIERKFLVRSDGWRDHVDRAKPYEQGYLTASGDCSVRVRIEGERAALNIKSATLGVRRHEFEYPIPVTDARELLERFCPVTVSKVRHFVQHAGKTWEVDVFSGANEGLVVAEVELADENEAFNRPDWIGEEVSGDPRYYNTELARRPYRQWPQDTFSKTPERSG